VSYNTGDIVAFEVATGQPRRTLSGHRGYVPALGFGSDGRRLISGSAEGAALVWDVTLAGAARRLMGPLTIAATEDLWATATGTDAKAAFVALSGLAAVPDRAVEILHRHVKPLPVAPTEDELERLFGDMDSNVFATREKASRRLAEMGEAAVPGVRKRLEQAASAEVRQRARAFLDQFDQTDMSPGRLGQLRAVELLEGIGSPAAKRFLLELAKGAVGAPLTLDAEAALVRLERRK
jgi:hypothetical protein